MRWLTAGVLAAWSLHAAVSVCTAATQGPIGHVSSARAQAANSLSDRPGVPPLTLDGTTATISDAHSRSVSLRLSPRHADRSEGGPLGRTTAVRSRWSVVPGGVRQTIVVEERASGRGPLQVHQSLESAAMRELGLGGREVFFRAPGGEIRLYVRNVEAKDSRLHAHEVRLRLEPGELIFEVEDANAVYPLQIQVVYGSAAWTVQGAQEGERLGQSLASAGDVNGDGFTDLLVGAPLWGDTVEHRGRVMLYLGGPLGPEPEPAWTAYGIAANGEFGAAVSGAGDVDGDGYADFLVGEPAWRDGSSVMGKVHLYLGSPSRTPELLQSFSGTVDSDFGRAVAGAFDPNGDGFGDALVGAPGTNLATGATHLLLGSPAGLVPGATLRGPQEGARFGAAVAGAGDVDGDGFDDFVVGAPGHDSTATDAGSAFVYPGGTTVPGRPPWRLDGTQAAAAFGSACAGAGDVDGDGRADVLVGAPLWDGVDVDTGRAFLFAGSTTGPIAEPRWVADSERRRSLLGTTLSGGDLDADGFSDVAVGAPGGRPVGTVHMFRGSAQGLDVDPFMVREREIGFGTSLALVDGVEGDPFADLLVGSPTADYGGIDVERGQADLFRGFQPRRSEFFLDCTLGADHHDGSAADRAWRTLAHAAYAIGSSDATLYVLPGTCVSDEVRFADGIDLVGAGAEASVITAPLVVTATDRSPFFRCSESGSRFGVAGLTISSLRAGECLLGVGPRTVVSDAVVRGQIRTTGGRLTIERSTVEDISTGGLLEGNRLWIRDSRVNGTLVNSSTTDSHVLVSGSELNRIVSGSRSALTVERCQFRGGSGTAILAAHAGNYSGTLHVESSLFQGYETPVRVELGGQISAPTRVTIVGNTFADYGRGGVLVVGNPARGVVQVRGNAFVGAAPALVTPNDTFGAVLSNNFDMRRGAVACFGRLCFGSAALLNEAGRGSGNLGASSLFVDAAGGDYRLTPGSPLVDAYLADGPALDLVDVARPQDGNGDGVAAFDIGAYERGSNPTPGLLERKVLRPVGPDATKRRAAGPGQESPR